MSPWKRNNTFPLYCCWPTCSCQQYKTGECCHGNVTICSLCIAVDLHVAGNHIKLLNVVMETQQYVPFVLLLTYMQLSTIQNCWMLSWKRNNTLPLYWCWPTCSCQQYKTAECCQGNVTIRYLCIAVDLHVAVNNIKPLNGAMETQQCGPTVLLLSYKPLRTAAQTTSYYCPKYTAR